MKIPLFTSIAFLAQGLVLSGMYNPYGSGPAITNDPAPSSPSTISKVDGVTLTHPQTTALLKYFIPHVPVEVELANHNTNLNPLVLELPSGTNAFRLSSGNPVEIFSFQKFNQAFVQLEGPTPQGLGVTEFDEGPRASISLTNVPLNGTFTPVVVTTDTPKCACAGSSCDKTGVKPTTESPATSPSEIGLTASFPLGLVCCSSGEIPGVAVWSPGNLTNGWNSLGSNVIALPNNEMLPVRLDRINVGSIEQWRTDASLVQIESTATSLTISTFLTPPTTVSSGNGLYDVSQLFELTRTVLQAGTNAGEVTFKSYFEGALVQSYLLKETTAVNSPVAGQDTVTVVSTNLLSSLRKTTTSVTDQTTKEVVSTVLSEGWNSTFNYVTTGQKRSTHQLKEGWYRLVEHVDALGSAIERTSTYEVFDDYGHPLRLLNGDGSWMVRLQLHSSLGPDAYDIKITPFLDSPPPTGNQAALESMSLNNYVVSYWDNGPYFITKTGGKTTGEVDGYFSLSSNGELMIKSGYVYQSSSSFGLYYENWQYTFAHPQKRLRGKPVRVVQHNGAYKDYDYEFGSWDPAMTTWTPNVAGNDLRTTATDGNYLTSDLANRGRQVIHYENLRGEEVYREEQINEGNNVFSTYSTTVTNRQGLNGPYGLLFTERKRDGRVISLEVENSSFSTTSYDETGRRFDTIKDPAGRTVSQKQYFDYLVGRTTESTTYSYFGLETQVTRTAGPNSTTSSRISDLLGRTIQTVSPEGKIGSYQYPDLFTTDTVFLGTTVSRSTRYIDGSAKEAFRADPAANNALVLVSSRNQTVSASGEITTTQNGIGRGESSQTVDWTGRTVQTSTPSGTGAGFVTTSHDYNWLGQLISVTSTAPNVPDRLMRYHPFGHVEASGEDTNGDGQLTLGQDRMTERDTYFVKDNGVWWSHSQVETQAGPAPQHQLVVQTSRSRIQFTDPSTISESISTAPNGGVTTSVTSVLVNAGGFPLSTITTTVDSPDSNLNAVTVSKAGFPVSATSHLTAVAETWTYSETPGALITSHTNTLGGVTKTYQNRFGQTVQVRDPVNNRNLYSYGVDPLAPSIGQLISSTNGANETVTYDYDIHGRKVSQTGATYPIGYTYDLLNRMTAMTTYRDEGAPGSGSVTSWSYDPHSGLQLGKLYNASNPNPKGPSYEYDEMGRILKLMRARMVSGTSTPVTVTYSYTANGDLDSTIYNDGTANVSYVNHDLFGRPGEVADSQAGVTSYTYSDTNNGVTNEAFPLSHSFYPDLNLDRGFTPLGKRNFVTVSLALSDLFTDWAWYDSQGRQNFNMFSHDDPLALNTGQIDNYVYEFYEGSTIPKVKDSIEPDEFSVLYTANNLDSSFRLNSTRATFDYAGGAVVSSMGYTHDRAGRRTHATREDGTTWKYDYNQRGEVTNAAKLLPTDEPLAGQQFGYTYDDIGNRKTARYGGGTGTNAGIQREIGYAVDKLNQYTSISHPQTADILGLQNPLVGSGVSVTGELAPADQQGPRFRSEVQASQANGEWFDVEVTNGIDPPASQGARWIPAANSAPTYDDDGNLTNDGRWQYTWNGANRLTKLQPTANALLGGHPNTILEFAYDHLGRRARKQVLDGSNGNAVLSDRRFLYDGWNLIAEFEFSQGALDPVAYHCWTPDLSGSAQGAGGVGGLYASRVKRDDGVWEFYSPTYDGNGNIITWVISNSSVAQRLDYDAFGNELTKNGTLPSGVELNFGFSTKYQDQETGLLYYGYRYYDPVTGRWPSRDPIEERGGINLYGMVGNDVVNRIDRLGLAYFVTDEGIDIKWDPKKELEHTTSDWFLNPLSSITVSLTDLDFRISTTAECDCTDPSNPKLSNPKSKLINRFKSGIDVTIFNLGYRLNYEAKIDSGPLYVLEWKQTHYRNGGDEWVVLYTVYDHTLSVDVDYAFAQVTSANLPIKATRGGTSLRTTPECWCCVRKK